MQISTLRRIVEALGGKLEIIAVLPDDRVALSQFVPPRARRSSRGQAFRYAWAQKYAVEDSRSTAMAGYNRRVEPRG